MPRCAAPRCAVDARQRAVRPAAQAPAVPRPAPPLRPFACACGGSCPHCKRPSAPAATPEDAALERDADGIARHAGPLLAAVLPAIPVDPTAVAAAATAALRPAWPAGVGPVRLHTGDRSAAASRRLNARAFTFGNDIHFDRGQFQPRTAEGRHLIAHELAHVAQQRRLGPRVQRSPYADAASTDDLHDALTDDYASQFPDAPKVGGLQYTQGYRQFLGAAAANGVKFLPTTFTARDPLRGPGVAANGLTTFTLNGQATGGGTLGAVISAIQNQLTPTSVVHAPGLVTGQVQCRFDPAQRIESGTHVDELTPPPQGGWKGRLAPAAVGAAGACGAKASVPVTLTDASGDPAQLEKLVHDSEMEHVAELRALHDRHLVSYARFMLGLTATAGNAADCEARLRPRLAQRDEQAATAFALGDLAATRRYDDPASTHHSVLTPTVSPGCGGVTLTARQTNPPLPGAGPGNVMPVVPQSTAVDPAALAVNGSTLSSGGTVVRVFASAADAATAMAALATLGVTEIQRIGPVEILLAGAQAATGSLTGLTTLTLHPDQVQVTPGVPNMADWVISEVVGDRFVEIANFGVSRDQAYGAAALMVQHAIRLQSRIGPAGGAGLTFYTA